MAAKRTAIESIEVIVFRCGVKSLFSVMRLLSVRGPPVKGSICVCDAGDCGCDGLTGNSKSIFALRVFGVISSALCLSNTCQRTYGKISLCILHECLIRSSTETEELSNSVDYISLQETRKMCLDKALENTEYVKKLLGL
uniref:Uncharacterized protein n=1 Tax=Glossina palpalis gambiensis TaxID=67801 RepID=A0A1B0BMJ2_9MUSC